MRHRHVPADITPESAMCASFLDVRELDDEQRGDDRRREADGVARSRCCCQRSTAATIADDHVNSELRRMNLVIPQLLAQRHSCAVVEDPVDHLLISASLRLCGSSSVNAASPYVTALSVISKPRSMIPKASRSWSSVMISGGLVKK